MPDILHWDDVPPYGDSKADRREIRGTAGALKRVAVKAGTVADRHAHAFEQFFFVQHGTGTLTTDSGTIELRPGLVVHFQPHEHHSAIFTSDTVLIEVNFNP